MRVIIVGGGRTGSYLAQLLKEDGHEVALLEKSAQVFNRLVAKIEVRHFQADGCDPAKLEEAGARGADLLVAVTGDDEDNLVISWLAKTVFQIKRVIARVNNPRNQWLFTPEWGVDIPISGVQVISKLIEEEATLGDVVTLLKLREGEVAIVELKLPATSPVVGRALSEIALPENTVLVAVLRDKQILIPTAKTVFQSGDELLAVTAVTKEAELRDLLVSGTASGA